MKATIISIGEELTEGLYPDTNSQFLSDELTSIGIKVIGTSIVPDDLELIKEAIIRSGQVSDIIISTGGLGPTDDDLTRQAFAEALDMPLVFDENEKTRIKELFKKYKWDYPKDNDRQAYFPKGSSIIVNKYGTASGFFINKNNVKYFTLPGVPSQAKKLYGNFIKHEISKNLEIKTSNLCAKLFGIGEAKMNELFREKIDTSNIKWGTLFKSDGLYLKVRAYGENAKKRITKVKKDLKDLFKEKIWGWDADELPLIIKEKLINKNLTLATAESCTGGLIGKLVTDISGSSRYYVGGAVVYSNELKIKLLNVNEDDINKYGAVSEQVAFQLAENTKKKFNVDCSIGVSGIAGPTGGSDEKPVGLVWIGISTPNGTKTYKCQIPGNRDNIRLRAAYYALNLLQKELL